MPIEEKIIFSSIIIILSVVFMFLNMSKIKAGSKWKLGKKDPVRNMLFTEKGEFRKYSKAGIVLWFMSMLILIWVVPGT